MEDYELIFEDVVEVGSPRKRIGKSKATGVKLVEMAFDEFGRVVEKLSFKDDGTLNRRVVYEYDQSNKPLVTSAYDANGKLEYQYERGKLPKWFE